jgi:hypothetical protein
MTVDQTEHMHVVMSPDAEAMSARQNKHYAGTTCGNAIMGAAQPPDNDREWKMSIGQKKVLYGPEARTIDTEADNKSRLPPREDSDIEPVHFWAMTPLLYQEIIHRLMGKAVIDLTATDVFAMTCIEMGIPYLGICHTSNHVDCLKRRLTSAVFDKFTVEGSPLYKAPLAQTVNQATTASTGSTDTAVAPKAKARPKSKAKAKPAAKRAPRAVVAATEADGADGGEAAEEEDAEEEEADASGHDL